MTDPRIGCAELKEVAAELAVGSLSGGERASAVTHLAACPSCQQLMGELTGIADELLLLAPAIEPPPGFESRVLARVGEHARPRRIRLRSLAAIAATVVVAALGGGAAVHLIADDSPTRLRTGMAISESGNSTCWVTVSDGDPAALVITLDGSRGRSAGYLAEAVTTTGSVIQLGEFATNDGRGMLKAAVDMDGDDVTSVRVLAMDGKPLYEATFPAPTSGS